MCISSVRHWIAGFLCWSMLSSIASPVFAQKAPPKDSPATGVLGKDPLQKESRIGTGANPANSPTGTPTPQTLFDPRSALNALPGKKTQPKSTIVEVEILTDGSLRAHDWLRVFEPMGVELRIRKPTGTEKLEITEREMGNIRAVKILGSMDRTGKIVLGSKSFALSDTAKLKEFIDDLKTYGAQGSPVGKPMWGLSKDQFLILYEALSKPASDEIVGQPVVSGIQKLKLPEQYALRWSLNAEAKLKGHSLPPEVLHPVKPFTTATALAIALNDAGLGFRPGRTPAGAIELVIEPRGGTESLWPIGWPLQANRAKVAPKLFANTDVALDQVVLGDVLLAIEKLVGIPVLVDHFETTKAKIDLDAIKISIPPKQTSWSLALKNAIAPAKLSMDVWQDEAGTPFVWILPTRASLSKTE